MGPVPTPPPSETEMVESTTPAYLPLPQLIAAWLGPQAASTAAHKKTRVVCSRPHLIPVNTRIRLHGYKVETGVFVGR